MNLLTIITTVYNSFDKMQKYFASLNNQSNKNFDLIIVDDSSKDNSFEKIVEYINNDEFLSKITRVLKTKANVGPGGARNLALPLVDTDYFMFLDSDDYISSSAVEGVINDIVNTKSDCIIYDTFIVNKNQQSKRKFCKSYGFIYVKKAFSAVNTGICSKVYKTSIVKNNNLTFPYTYNAEDMAFNVLYYSECKSIFHSNKTFYYYIFEQGSLSNGDIERKRTELNKTIDYLYKADINSLIKCCCIRERVYLDVLYYVSQGKTNKFIRAKYKQSVSGVKFTEILSVCSFKLKVLFTSLKFGFFPVLRGML